MGQLLTMFVTILIAELGDKTQLATLLFAAERTSPPWKVFVASAGALVLGAGISVAIGAFGGRWLEHAPVKLIAGLGFLAIGAWSILQHFRGA